MIESGSELAQVHVGADEPFGPAAPAHPGLRVGTVEKLDALAERTAVLAFELSRAERDTRPVLVRFHTRGGFVSRIEVLASA